MSQPRSKLNLTANKRALLQALLAEKGVAAAASHDGVPRRTDAGPAPLSFAQERIWLLDQIAGATPLFNVPGAVPLRGPLDADLLRRCLLEVVRRHETLRTTFDASSGRPRQVIAPPPAAVDLPVIDVAAAGADLQALLRAESRRTFDLAEGPLWRMTLFQVAADDHVLMLCMHHTISEAASLGVMFDELRALYGAFAAGQPSPLAELPIQYADYAAWQRRWVSDEIVGRQMGYWVERLGGDLPTVQLPLDRPRPASQTFAGGFCHRRLPAATTDACKSLAQAHSATPFMVFLAAFNALLARYSGQQDIVVGAPIARRDRAELAGLIGFFVNTIVLRTEVDPRASFVTLLGAVREVALGAFSHSDLPFELVVEELQPERDQSQNPMFQVMFDLPAEPRPEMALPGLRPARVLEPWDVHTGTSKIDLALFVWDAADGMEAAVEYNTDLFDAATIERLLDHYAVLLEGIVAAPDVAIGDLEMLTAIERQRCVIEWNDTATPFPDQTCVHELVRQQAARAPDALAVAGAGGQLSYLELEQRANQLAHLLRGHGVGPDVLVAVCMERTPAMVTALLAVMKAGGAYVPLDPANPADRQALMLEDSGAPVLITESGLLVGLPPTSAIVICCDRDAAAIDMQPKTAPAVEMTSEHLAYVIFTSGSTGRPKGVQNSHRGLMNLVSWHQAAYQVTPADRAGQFAGLAFDASVWELWPYLTAGASVHLPDEETRAHPAELMSWLVERAITVTFLPTPLAEAVLQESPPPGLALRALLTGGDKLRRPPPPGLPFELINHYGPSENAVVATCTRVAASVTAAAPPIGRQLPNVDIYLVDAQLRPVPIGVPGEILVGGASLSRGYHGRADLTAEKFIPHPFRDGQRLYRTGDLARYRADGQIEFLGRLDHQVKVRGFRIELGEIEAVLARHPAVREALVMTREDKPGHRQLVGYVVANGETTDGALRDHLRDKLPDYMVPSAIVVLDAFPLTTNGKIDRRALPAAEENRVTDTAPPETDLERQVASIWSTVLSVENVGVDENFFDLGGHSLLMVQIRNRLTAELERSVSMVVLFKYPTVRALAAALDAPAPAQTAASTTASTGERDARRDAMRRRREQRRQHRQRRLGSDKGTS